MRHLPPLPLVCYIFLPNLLKFTKCKFGPNPFFRPVEELLCSFINEMAASRFVNVSDEDDELNGWN